MGDAVLLASRWPPLASVACLVVPFVTIWRLTILQRQVAALAARLEALELRNAPHVPPAHGPGQCRAGARRILASANNRSGGWGRARALALRRPEPELPAAAAAAPTLAKAKPSADLEAILGGQWMLYAGLLVLLLASPSS